MNSTIKEPQIDLLAKKAAEEIDEVLKTQKAFVKVHAAEYLIWLGQIDKARAVFLAEEKEHHDVPKYRVVIWRVLAQTEKSALGKKKWSDQIFAAFADENGQDRIHAAETLGKLKLSPVAKYAKQVNGILNTEKENLYVYTLWAASQASITAYETNKLKFLNLLYNSKNDDLRRISAFVLRKEGRLTRSEWTTLSKTALSEPESSALKQTLLHTAFATCPADVKSSEEGMGVKKAMLANASGLAAGLRIELSLVLADHGNSKDLPILAAYLDDENSEGCYDKNSPLGADLRATAAYGILKIKKRKK